MTIDRPDVLYKYRCYGAADPHGYTQDILDNSRFYFPSPQELNDPFDCNPHEDLEVSHEEAKQYIVSFSDEDIDRRIDNPTPTKRRREREKLVRALTHPNSPAAHTIGKTSTYELTQFTGICSFTRNRAHPLMWAHYADSHRGICLEFDLSKCPDYQMNIDPVQYCDKRLHYRRYNVEMRQNTLRLIPYSKATAWEYEEEWRILHDREKRGTKCDFPPEMLTGVIFGLKTSDQDKRKITTWAEERTHPVTLYQATLDAKDYVINIENL